MSLSATTEYDRSRQPAIPCAAPALATLADHAGPEHDYVSCDARAGCPTRWSPPKRSPRDTHLDRSLPTRTEARADSLRPCRASLLRGRSLEATSAPLFAPAAEAPVVPFAARLRVHAPPKWFALRAAGGAPSRTDPHARFHVRDRPDPPLDARRPRSARPSNARANSCAFETLAFPQRDRLRSRNPSGVFRRSKTLDRHSVVALPKVSDLGSRLSDRSRRAACRRLLHTRKRAFRGPPARIASAVALTCAPLCTSRYTRRCSSLILDANASNARLAHTRESKTPS